MEYSGTLPIQSGAGMELARVNHEAPTRRIGDRRQVDFRTQLVLHLDPEIVRHLGRENQRRAFDWKYERRMLQAKYFLRACRSQSGQGCHRDDG